MQIPLNSFLFVAEHEGASRNRIVSVPASLNHTVEINAGGASWELRVVQGEGEGDYEIHAKVLRGSAEQVAIGMGWEDPEWSVDNFVLIPGAVYGGNRFHAEQYDYSPPKLGPDPKKSDRTPWTGDIPRLNLNSGKSHLDQMSIDAATPGLGIQFRAKKKAMCLLTAQGNDVGPFGLEVVESRDRSSAQVLLSSPGFRKEKYFTISGYCEPSQDRAADFSEGTEVRISFKLYWIDCECPQDLFDFVFEHRYDCFDRKDLKNEFPFSQAWELLHRKHNEQNWREAEGVFQVSILQDPPNPFMLFQTGWVGGMITPYPMIQEGDDISLERALRNMDVFFSGAQTEFGLYHEFYFDGKWCSKMKSILDGYGNSKFSFNYDESWTLVRRMGDVLYFGIRQFLILHEKNLGDRIVPEWENSLRKSATAIGEIWERFGEFGQYIDVTDGELKVAGSTAGALIPAGLILASDYFKEERYLQLAADIAEKYRREDLSSGITTGGPGDCVQAPESESVAALIESFILLYEKTQEKKWLKAAEDATVQAASWVLSYDYEFPKGTALAEIGAQSRGVFIANAQNKTGVPGICTLSGQGILRLYRATGDERYLELLKEIAHSIPQYIGRPDKKIPTRLKWGRKGLTHLPEGWLCERVNITQWGELIGEIAAYSCWCEVAMMLTWCDLPGIYGQPDTGVLKVLDHIEASWVERSSDTAIIELKNTTQFNARVRIQLETSTQAKEVQSINYAAQLPQVSLKAGEIVHYSWSFEK